MRRSRQLLLRAEMRTGGRRLPLDVLAVADPEGTRLPTSIVMLWPLVLLVLTVELHAARPSPTRKRGVRYAALSELPVHEALLLHTGSASRALDRAYRIAYSGCACSDQHWSSLTLFSLAASTLQPCARRRSGELHCIIAWGWCSARMGHTSVPYFAIVRVLSCP